MNIEPIFWGTLGGIVVGGIVSRLRRNREKTWEQARQRAMLHVPHPPQGAVKPTKPTYIVGEGD
jgi:hypothetical protein